MELPKEIKEKKIDPVGLSYYGANFTRYMKIGEILDLIPAFKDLYYAEKVKDPNCKLTPIIREFEETVCLPVNRLFHPYPTQLKLWRAKWDLDLMQQKHDNDFELAVERKNVRQEIKTRDESRRLVLGQIQDSELEAGVKTLGGELLNDALQMLRDDQELEETIDNEMLIKRRNYILNVFGHATKLVHGKAALMLKASEEKRNNASFLMTLLATATSGKLTEEQMDMLKTTYKPTVKVEQNV